MDFSGYHYYKFTIDLLRHLGLWNLNAGWLERFQRLAFCALFTVGILCQITAYFTNEYNLQMISRSVVFIVGVFMCFDQYLLFYANIDRMRTLFARLRRDWNTVRGADEYNILKTYTKNGKFVTNLHLACFVPILLCIVVLEFLPNILDVVAPLNQSRSHQFPIMVELFLEDSASKHILIYAMADVTLAVGAATLIASGSFIFMLIEHVCAMFKITSYRIQRAINEQNECLIYVRLLDAVLVHQRTIEFIELFKDTVTPSFSYLFAAGMISVLMNMYHLSQVITVTRDMKNFAEAALFVLYQYFYMCATHNLAQMTIDHSSDIFTETYETLWYRIPLSAQKLIIFIMQRSMKSSTLMLYGLYVPSRQSFTVLCNTMMSYLTFLCSVQS
ncbi:unnamed protein product [Xylocopa violacea]|uniref:Odorant receptor n=1 Tax=Xylocopa violacea TaxID=135666 RepID=A0ABP1MZ82_XYLVO